MATNKQRLFGCKPSYNLGVAFFPSQQIDNSALRFYHKPNNMRLINFSIYYYICINLGGELGCNLN